MKQILILALSLVLSVFALPATAQDGLNLPTELYILTTTGRVQRFGLGTEGVRTVTTEDEFVIDFGVAPDGNWIAYRTEDFFAIRHVFSETAQVVERGTASVPPIRGRGETVAWSPRGEAVAYTTLTGARVFINSGATPVFTDIVQEADLAQLIWSPDGRFLVVETEEHVWWVYRRDGNDFVLASAIPSSVGIAWVSGGTLVFAPEEGGLSTMNMDAANQQTLLLDDTWFYRRPQRLNDGSIVLFARQKTDNSIEPSFGRLIGLSPNAPVVSNLSEIAIDHSAVSWIAQDTLLTVFRGGVVGLIDPITGQGAALPIANAATFSWGPPQMTPVAGGQLPADSYFISEDQIGAAQVWRLAADADEAIPITAQEAGVVGFAVSPDGGSIVYNSGTSLWLQGTEPGAEALEMVKLGSAGDAQPAFSPDGTRVAYVNDGIWQLSLDDGSTQQLVADVPGGADANAARRYSEPRFALNLDALLVTVQLAGGRTSGILDPNAGQVATLAPGLVNGRWLASGEVATHAPIGNDARAGVHITSVNSLTEPAILLPEIISITAVTEVAPGQLRLVVIPAAAAPGPARLQVLDMRIDNGQIGVVSTQGFVIDPIFSPDGRFVAGYRQQAEDGRGPLTFVNLESGEQFSLSQAGNVWNVQWGP